MIYPQVRNLISMTACAVACAVASPTAYGKEQYHFKFIPEDSQNLAWNKGVSSIDNSSPESIVRVIDSRDDLPDNQTTFRVTVLNTGGKPVNVVPENIWIEDAEGNRVVMLNQDELEGRHRRDVKRRQALAALGGALSAGSADGYTSGSFDYNGTTSNGTFFHGFGTYSAYDPNLAMQERQAAEAQSQATFNAIQVRKLQGVEALNGMLRQTTLHPGEITSGVVAFDPSRNLRKKAGQETVTIVVKIGTADHRFKAMLIPRP